MSPSTASRFLVGCCTFLFFAASAWAETTAATAEALMRKSGLWDQLADVAPQVRAGVLVDVARAGRKPSETEIQRLSRAVDSVYTVHRFRSACLAAISRDLAMTHVAALRRWYDGPSGRSITKLELAQSKQDPRTTIEQGAALLRTMPMSRRRILDEIVLVTRSAELMTELNISTALASHLAIASVSPSSTRRPSISELKAAFDAQRQQLIRTFSALSLASYAAAYASVPAAELEGYVDFLKSEAGRQFIAIGTGALSAAMFDAAAELARAVPGSKDKAHT